MFRNRLSYNHGFVVEWYTRQTQNLLLFELVGSNPTEATICGSNSVVESHVANVDVAGSNPVSRSILSGRIPAVLYTVHKTRVIGACGFKSRRPYHLFGVNSSTGRAPAF